MSDYIFQIVIIVLFLYEGIVMLTQKNGGNKRNVGRYTEESLAKYSMILGVAFLILAAYEVFILLNKMNVINVLSSIDNSVVRMLITIGPIVIIIVVMLITHFTVLKKTDEYADSSTGASKKKEEEEDF